MKALPSVSCFGSARRGQNPAKWWGVAVMVFFCVLAFTALADADSEQEIVPFRIAFSAATFGDINRSDAKAALIAWSKSIVRNSGIPISTDPVIYENSEELLALLKDRKIDGMAVTFKEYFVLPEAMFDLNNLFLNQTGGTIGEQYVLLVHREKNLDTIERLEGRDLTLWGSHKLNLARHWLDNVLTQKTGLPAEDFFGRINERKNLSQTVLQVFFGQHTACVVTRNGFNAICELNPQIGDQLRILATSPVFIPTLFCFRGDYKPPFLQQLIAAIENVHTTIGGQQVLTLFQCDRILKRPASCLDDSRKLMESYETLEPLSWNLPDLKLSSFEKERRSQ